MLSLIVASTQSFNAPMSRRDASVLGLSAALGLAPAAPAFAELYGEGKAPKVDQATSVKRAKEIKYMQPLSVAGQEGAAFKKAEADRIAAQEALAAGKPLKKESVDENLARLGLKTYGS